MLRAVLTRRQLRGGNGSVKGPVGFPSTLLIQVASTRGSANAFHYAQLSAQAQSGVSSRCVHRFSSLAGSLVVGRPHRLCFLPRSSRSTRGGSPPLCGCYVRLLEYTVSFGWRQRSQSSPALACRVRDTPLSRLPLRGSPPVALPLWLLAPTRQRSGPWTREVRCVHSLWPSLRLQVGAALSVQPIRV